MPERKIADAPKPCFSWSEHHPATMLVREPGTYEHTCPSCGYVTKFVVCATY